MKQHLIPLMKKKGALGLDTVKVVMITFLTLAVIGVAVILALTSLNGSSIFTAGSQAQNQSNSITSNVSTGLTTFFANTGTIFSILVVVVIIAAISLIILYVRRFGGEAGGSV